MIHREVPDWEELVLCVPAVLLQLHVVQVHLTETRRQLPAVAPQPDNHHQLRVLFEEYVIVQCVPAIGAQDLVHLGVPIDLVPDIDFVPLGDEPAGHFVTEWERVGAGVQVEHQLRPPPDDLLVAAEELNE